MQTLETINVGQAPNDGTGDEHRTAFQKVNTNFDRVVQGVGEIGTAAQEAADAAQAAGQVAAGAIPASEKGEAGGVAPLDAAGKVPAAHLPEQEEFIPMAQKGVAEGVATLGPDGKVTSDQLPNAVDAIPLTEKGQPGGVATLDDEGKVPAPQLAKGLAGGVAPLDSSVLIPDIYLPFRAHGQCRLVYVSASEIRLMPENGNGLIIDERQFRIPVAGVPLANTAFVASTLHYVYAASDGVGGVKLESAVAATNPHSRHTNGVEVKTSDPTRTLVGMALTSAANVFIWSSISRWVASWFNRRKVALIEASSNSPTGSTAPVKLTQGLYPLLWAGSVASIDLAGVTWSNAAGATGSYLQIRADTTVIAGGLGYTLSNSPWQVPTAVVSKHEATVDGLINFAPYGWTNNTTIPVTFRQDFNGSVEI
ncbi:hypothetical protein D3C86_1207810 [compost metagenome]